MKHLPGCTAKSLAEMYPDEQKPEGMSEASWSEVKIGHCESGCPVFERTLERGRELAREHGWGIALSEDGEGDSGSLVLGLRDD